MSGGRVEDGRAQALGKRAVGREGMEPCRGPGRFSLDDFGWGDAGQPEGDKLGDCAPDRHCASNSRAVRR